MRNQQLTMLALISLTLTAAGRADDQMVVSSRDGQVVLTAEMAQMRQITFTPEAMQLHRTDGAVDSVELDALGQIRFDATEGIDISLADMEQLDGPAHIYTMDGRLLKSLPHYSSEIVNQLPAGTYAVRLAGRTIKLMITTQQ